MTRTVAVILISMLLGWAFAWSDSPDWRPVDRQVAMTIVRSLGFDPGFDQQREETRRGRAVILVSRTNSSSLAEIDAATGLLCGLLYFSDEPPLLNPEAALSREEVLATARTFLERAGWRLGPEWSVRHCQMTNNGAAGCWWRVRYQKVWEGIRLPAYAHLVFHAGTGTVRSFGLVDDEVQSGLQLRVGPESAVAAVAARAGFKRYLVDKLELAIGYETPEWEGRQDLYWQMRLLNPDARTLQESEVMWARLNARTGRIVDFGMPVGSGTLGKDARVQTSEATSRHARAMAEAKRWTSRNIQRVKWPPTIRQAAANREATTGATASLPKTGP